MHSYFSYLTSIDHHRTTITTTTTTTYCVTPNRKPHLRAPSRRSSPDTMSQPDLSCTPNGGSNPPSPSKSAAGIGPRSPTRASSQSIAGPVGEQPTHNYETTFDLDGNVETASLSSSRDGRRSVFYSSSSSSSS